MTRFDMDTWQVRNFKSIGEAKIPLAHLTILSGMNSSGKSSLLQSVLFFAQSISKNSIVLNGPLVRLGLPEDVVRNGATSVQVGGTLELEIEENSVPSKFTWTATVSASSGGNFEVIAYEIVQESGAVLVSATNSRISAADKLDVGKVFQNSEFILRVTKFGGKQAPARTFMSLDGLMPTAFVFRRTEAEVGRTFSQIFPRHQLRGGEDVFENFMFFLNYTLRRNPKTKGIEATKSMLETLEPRIYSEQSGEPLINSRSYADLKMEYVQRISKSGWTRTRLSDPTIRDFWNDSFMRRYSLANSELQDETRLECIARVAAVSRHVAMFAKSIKYIGPLREQPQVVNSSYGADHPGLPVGARGESAAHALVDGRRKRIEFTQPDGTQARKLLSEAVAIWASYLGLGDAIDVEDRGKLGRGLQISVNGKARDLTMVGVGASQLLPIVLAALTVEPESLLIIEQPELHLHPAVQSRLADFLLIARPDVRFIVETHSEYLITRLRRRIAEQSVAPEQAHVFFAEQNRGMTKFQELSIDAMGNFEQWPQGFFDTQNEEARAIISAVSERIMKAKS